MGVGSVTTGNNPYLSGQYGVQAGGRQPHYVQQKTSHKAASFSSCLDTVTLSQEAKDKAQAPSAAGEAAAALEEKSITQIYLNTIFPDADEAKEKQKAWQLKHVLGNGRRAAAEKTAAAQKTSGNGQTAETEEKEEAHGGGTANTANYAIAEQEKAGGEEENKARVEFQQYMKKLKEGPKSKKEQITEQKAKLKKLTVEFQKVAEDESLPAELKQPKTEALRTQIQHTMQTIAEMEKQLAEELAGAQVGKGERISGAGLQKQVPANQEHVEGFADVMYV
jgi:hypothetical protein